MSQFEQENDLGRGGGEVDDETAEKAWRDRDALLGDAEPTDPKTGMAGDADSDGDSS